MTAGLKELFQGAEIFKDLSEVELLEILEASKPVSVPAGAMLFDAGDVGDAMYLIQAGQVRIKQPLPRQGWDVLATLETGQVFGEMAILDGSPRAARAVVSRTSQLCRLDRTAFNKLRSAYRPSAYKVIRAISMTLVRRLRHTNRRVARLLEDPEGLKRYATKRGRW